MAVAIDVASTGSSSPGTSSLVWSHTCSGTNRLLVVGVACGGATSTTTISASYNSVAMPSLPMVNSNNANDGGVVMFYQVAPPTGSHSILISNIGGTRDLGGGSISFTGVDQTTPLTNFNSSADNGSSISVSVVSDIGNMVVDLAAGGQTFTASGQTQQWNHNLNTNTGAGNSAQSTAAGAASVTMSYTMGGTDWWSIIGVNVLAATTVTPSTATVAWL